VGVIFTRLVIGFRELVKMALKRGEGKGLGWGREMGAAGFCGPSVCLGVFLLSWMVLVSRITGAGVVYNWYSRLVSAC
jgi:hypothetical protein